MALAAIRGDNRRGKTLLFLFCCALAGVMPHWLDPSTILFPAIFLVAVLGSYGLKIVLIDANKSFESFNIDSEIKDKLSDLQSVDVLVSVRDEENVVERLILKLQEIRYPQDKIKFWIIDDGSKDNTPLLLNKLSNKFDNINILSRSISSGGKSGALNFALQNVNSEWIFVLDADAQFDQDIFLRIIPYAKDHGFSVLQLRKAVSNANRNLLTCCQAMEMAMDLVIQQGRFGGGGISELRGNGQLIRRDLIDQCGGFNEDTVTDDLDLSFRLLFAKASVGIVSNPPVQEEAVETIPGLWRQRKRWAEGGLQRFFDYWSFLTSNKLNIRKRLDITAFFLLQYALPVVSFFDVLVSLLRHSLPAFWPLSLTAFSISAIAYFKGCRRKVEGPSIPKPNLLRLIISIIYLAHWFVVIPWVTFVMAFRPKQFIWRKTIHKGN
tara:strand:- start:49 stop:1359 length:1311 start_codon:yes stop_codon:yes gene_type:complete